MKKTRAMKGITLGNKYGMLTPIERMPTHPVSGNIMLKCICDCGATTITAATYIRTGRTESCGCQTGTYTKHEMSGTRTYFMWGNIKQKCRNKNHCSYNLYEGRGITVSDEWLKFENFYRDMGDIPKGFTVRLKDGATEYNKDNCTVEPIKKPKPPQPSNELLYDLCAFRNAHDLPFLNLECTKELDEKWDSTLKSCPFCGGEAYAYSIPPHKYIIGGVPDYHGGAFAECKDCTAILSGETIMSVTKAWNTRPIKDSQLP